MNWLGHYEFGLNQNYFLFGNEVVWDKYDKSELTYWLAIWYNYYSYVSRIFDAHTICLVHYEDLLKTPDKLKETLEANLGIELAKSPPVKFIPQKPIQENLYDIDNDLLDKANKLYTALISMKSQ